MLGLRYVSLVSVVILTHRFENGPGTFLNQKGLFTARDENGDLNDAAHIAQLIAALEPPPPEFLAKNPRGGLISGTSTVGTSIDFKIDAALLIMAI